VQNGGPACGLNTIAVPVDLADVRTSSNTIEFKATDYAAIANVDLILRGAAGLGCTANCPASTTTTLASSKNPSTFGDLVTLTATVASSKATPTGSVLFSDGTTALGSSTLNSAGKATLAIASLTVGTHALTALYDGTAAFASSESAPLAQVVHAVPPVLRFSWEDGGLDGWQQQWGESLSLANSTAEAYSGNHSLRMTVSATETHSAAANVTRADLAGFIPGAAVTLHVFSQRSAGIALYPFAFDQNWIPAFGPAVKLAEGWNTVTFTLPAGFKVVNGIGVQIDNPNAESDTLYLDAVTTK
jgi:hypothetical protein